MSFTSFEFLALLAGVLLIYGRLALRGQNRLLLAASALFYGWWDWRFLGLIAASAAVDFWCGARLGPDGLWAERPKAQRNALRLSLVFNLGLLGFFKYFGFFAESLRAALAGVGVEIDGPALEVVLPVGISFYTFQTMSYTLDRRRGEVPAVGRFDDFLVYVGFFPQLVAGPIERAKHFLPQVLARRVLDAERVSSGALLVLFGFFQKMVVADNLAPLVEATYRHSGSSSGAGLVSGAAVWLATLAFAVQIYADFSGYTDIARGTARMLGFELSLNFRLPYFATSPSEFWTGWHISLSSWLRDYLYIPLGGNRGGSLLTGRNLMITMLLGGLWHGAAWHFVAWGAWHGLLLVGFRAVSRLGKARAPLSGWRRGLGAALFFLGPTCLGWLLFRVDSLAAVPEFVGLMLTPSGWTTQPPGAWLSLAVFALPLLLIDVFRWRRGHLEPWSKARPILRAALILILFYAIVLFGSPHDTRFLYFQF